jgi:hypothetical protein
LSLNRPFFYEILERVFKKCISRLSGDLPKPASVETPIDFQKPTSVKIPMNLQKPASVEGPLDIEMPTGAVGR